MKRTFSAKNIFFLGLLLGATGLISPPVALAAGLAFALIVEHPFAAEARALARLLLQASVVLLGFSMNLGAVLAAGRAGLVYSTIGISCTMALGLLLGRLLRVERVSSTLIAAGTAICGGSAIAALGPVLEAGEEAMAVSLGAVFVLNSVALFLFPALGHWVGLTQGQFGVWAALAIHDTSSVVGAAAKFGPEALAIAVPVKLVRALWILPVCLIYAAIIGARARRNGLAASKISVPLPWFLLLFLLAAVVATFLPQWFPDAKDSAHAVFATLTTLGKSGLAVTLFLIGSTLNRRALARVGIRPLLQAIALWIISASASLWAIEQGWIRP